MIVHIWRNLSANKLRASLSMLGICVGSAAVVGLLYSGLLAADFSLNKIREMGTQLIAMTIVEEDSDGFSHAQLQQVAKRHKSIAKVVPLEISSSSFLSNNGKFDAPLLLAAAELKTLLPFKIMHGRFISQADAPGVTCVLGHKIVQKIAQSGMLYPVGEYLYINGSTCLIVGELGPMPNNFFLPVDLNEVVITRISNKKENIKNILIKFITDEALKQSSNYVMSDFHALLPEAKFYERTPKFLYDHMRSEKLNQQLLLGVIAAISLLVGGIGIMNIMLVSVWERESEIGLRLALGATKKSIKRMFLYEALFLSLVGGFLGVFLALIFSYILSIASGWSFNWYWWPIAIGQLASFVIGIFFGYYPAFKAAQVDPIKSLKGV